MIAAFLAGAVLGVASLVGIVRGDEPQPANFDQGAFGLGFLTAVLEEVHSVDTPVEAMLPQERWLVRWLRTPPGPSIS